MELAGLLLGLMVADDKPDCLHLGLESHLIIKTNKLGSFLFMIKSFSQTLGYAPPVTLATNGSVLPHAFILKGYYGDPVVTTLQPCLCFKRLL